ncbi:MAG: hypothetical protein HFJ12_01745 [Bacilli bacterium]|nr:hypothetical protein [Bacilli bacterium]
MIYLIPANTKRGQLILGLFRPFDLILFGLGILLTIILMVILPLTSTVVTVIVMLPSLITGFLVVPVPHYHNILNVILELIEFFTNQRDYKWKGWCIRIGEGKRKRKKQIHRGLATSKSNPK